MSDFVRVLIIKGKHGYQDVAKFDLFNLGVQIMKERLKS
jgi:hypothetical protein